MKLLFVIFLYFSFCSFLGWLIETSFRTIKDKKFVNSGFLYGPFVPIYGFAAIFIFLLDTFSYNLFLPARLIIFILIPTIIEYLTSFLFEKILNLRLWDYSDQRFNLHGRICLKFSIIWIFLVLADIFIVQKFIIVILNKLPISFLQISSTILFIYFTIDLFFTVKVYQNFILIIDKLKSFEFNKETNPKDIFINNPILLKLKDIFRPISAFPHLLVYVQDNIYNIFNILQDAVGNNIKSKSESVLNYLNDNEFSEIIKDIINNSEYQKLKTIHHHEHSIYNHSLHVAWLSYKIGKYIDKYTKIRIVDLTRGALLHDFFLYNWRKEKPPSGKLHAFEHPKEALKNAQCNFYPISKIEKDIILKHMWPLNLIPPRYIETLIVVIVDKLIASKELIIEYHNNNKIKRNKKKS
ncbi:MAG: hypothetical protein WHS77_06715 [Brevinematales bacterium]